MEVLNNKEKSMKNKKEDMKMKCGGKAKKYSKGGSVGSASKRADGVATKGHTKGRMLQWLVQYVKRKLRLKNLLLKHI